MADIKKKEVQTPFFTTEKVTLYAPLKAVKKEGTLYHEPGEKIEIHPNLVEKFKGLGYTETAPAKIPVKADGADGKDSKGEPGTMMTK